MNEEQRKAKIKNYASLILLGGAALVLSPIVFLVVKGLIGLFIAFCVGSAGIAAAPVLSRRTWD